MTLREALEHGAAQLSAGPHPEKARRDTELLLMHQVGKNRAWLLGHFNEEFAGCLAIGYAALLERRKRGEPMQYILGETEFYGLPFRITPDVLIPRPETEHLVEKALTLAASFDSPQIVDVGTGSGAIAVALARYLPKAQVTATDISTAALVVAEENARRNRAAERVRFAHGDLLATIAGERFDLVVSNPPYVPESERASLSVEVREYEPALALFAGDDGLDVYRSLIPAAFAGLSSGGYTVLEIGDGQAEAVAALLRDAGFEGIDFTPDLQGIDRIASARRP